MAKTMRAEDKEVLQVVTKNGITKEVEWFYNEVNKVKGKIKKEDFSKVKTIFEERGICLSGDIVGMLGWGKETHKEERKRYVYLTNDFSTLYGADKSDINFMFFNAVKKYFNKEYKHPMDAFLSKNEQRKVNKKRKVEKRDGIKKEITKLALSEDEKKIKSRLRKIKREAAKEGMDIKAYMIKYNYGEDGRKIK